MGIIGGSITIQDIPWHLMYSRLSINPSLCNEYIPPLLFYCMGISGCAGGAVKTSFRVWLRLNVFCLIVKIISIYKEVVNTSESKQEIKRKKKPHSHSSQFYNYLFQTFLKQN